MGRLNCTIVLGVMTSLFGCSLSQVSPEASRGVAPEAGLETSLSATEDLAVQPDRSEAEKTPIAELAPEEVPSEEELQAPFCSDDVFSRYLADQFKKNNASRAKYYKSKRSRRRYLNRRQSQALYYASERLNGHSAAQQTSSFPLVMNKRVKFWIDYFRTKGKRSFLTWMVRGESFRDTIVPLLKQEGLPLELFYLAMVESGFNNRARSRAKASGTWQFMAGTARLYGLKVNYWVDERRDPTKATLAAARFLKDLYKQFGDWYLALASYNAGPGRVRRAIRKSGSKDFWVIADKKLVSKETRNYIPKMIAAVTLAKNPSLHGLDIRGNGENIIPTSGVLLDRPIDMDDLANNLGVSVRQLRYWNPELQTGITPPKRIWQSKAGYWFRLSAELADRYHAVQPQLARIKIKDILFHRVRNGDTLYRIARRYKVSVSKILRVNPKVSPKRLRIGKKLAIPIPSVTRGRKSVI